MRLQEFQRARRAHLRRDHAGDVLLHWNIVNDREALGALENSQGSSKSLPLFSLPMKSDPDRDVVKSKRRRVVCRRQRDLRYEPMPPSRVNRPRGVNESPTQLDFNGRPPFHHSDRYVHKCLAISSNMSSCSVTSLNMPAPSAP